MTITRGKTSATSTPGSFKDAPHSKPTELALSQDRLADAQHAVHDAAGPDGRLTVLRRTSDETGDAMQRAVDAYQVAAFADRGRLDRDLHDAALEHAIAVATEAGAGEVRFDWSADDEVLEPTIVLDREGADLSIDADVMDSLRDAAANIAHPAWLAPDATGRFGAGLEEDGAGRWILRFGDERDAWLDA